MDTITLSCPICGFDSALISSGHEPYVDKDGNLQYTPTLYRVQCKDVYCKCSTGKYEIGWMAIEAWSKRTGNKIKPKTGHWIEHEWAEEVGEYLISNYECSECHTWKREDSSYCPDCGIKMKGVVKGES